MAMPEMEAVKDAALKYDKPTLARLAQSGQLSPTLAVMAGMMRDRIVQSEMKPPTPPTVAEEVMQPMGQRMGLGAIAPGGQPQAPQQPQQAQPQGQGVDQVPVPQQMFERQGMANGGIVAFQAGGGARNPRLIGALENVLSQLQARDPALNVDYVRRAVLSAPESQQRTLMQQLVERVGMDDQFKPAAASFTEALKTKEVDPNVMRAMQLSGGLTPDEMATPSPLDQAETGAQPGARPGVRDFTGSEVYAGLAQRAGNIYEGGANPLTGAMDIARSGMRGVEEAGRGLASLVRGRSPEQRLRAELEGADQPMVPPSQQVDPISGTQTFDGYPAPITADPTQADTGAAVRDGEPSDIMRKIADDEQRREEERKAKEAAAEKPKDKRSIMDRAGDMAKQVTGQSDIKIPTVAEASKETADLLKESGFDTTLFKTLQADVAKQREELKGDRKESMNLRLIEAGLGIMGGESPYAFVNIGKGATPAIKGLGEDIKGLKKAERELVNAERDLQMKENDFALGKARISQSSIDKARERSDKERSEFTRLQGQFANTMLSGEIQEAIAKATVGSRITDFDKQWRLYSAEATARGETPTWTGFTQAKQAGMTQEDAVRIASQMDTVKNLDLNDPNDQKIYKDTINFIMQQGRRPLSATPTGKEPPLPLNFIKQ
jgi:hypothetical protein